MKLTYIYIQSNIGMAPKKKKKSKKKKKKEYDPPVYQIPIYEDPDVVTPKV